MFPLLHAMLKRLRCVSKRMADVLAAFENETSQLLRRPANVAPRAN